MKVMKLALLGTAALAAVSVSARADDLADLKSQIEALNSRISQLEAAPAVPAGYQLLSVSEAPAVVVPTISSDVGYGANATTIGILPTADVPASTTIQWSGYARAGLVHSSTKVSESGFLTTTNGTGTYAASLSSKDSDTDIYARGQLKVVGTTDTAVGEVGAWIEFRANLHGVGGGDTDLFINDNAFGWWKMTPELTLIGGYTDTLANIGYGYDGACNCYYTDNAPVALNPGDTTQLRLAYASGPLSFAIALEDGDQEYSNGDATVDVSDSLGVAGKIKYAGDTFSGEIGAGYWGKGKDSSAFYPQGAVSATDGDDAWQIGAGLGFSLDPVSLSLAAGAGQDHLGFDYWKASALASVNLSDSVHAEIAYGYANSETWVDRSVGFGLVYAGEADAKTHAVLAGIYYDPVSQLTIGLEGEWYQTKTGVDPANDECCGGDLDEYSSKLTSWQVDLVTVFRF